MKTKILMIEDDITLRNNVTEFFKEKDIMSFQLKMVFKVFNSL